VSSLSESEGPDVSLVVDDGVHVALEGDTGRLHISPVTKSCNQRLLEAERKMSAMTSPAALLRLLDCLAAVAVHCEVFPRPIVYGGADETLIQRRSCARRDCSHVTCSCRGWRAAIAGVDPRDDHLFGDTDIGRGGALNHSPRMEIPRRRIGVASVSSLLEVALFLLSCYA